METVQIKNVRYIKQHIRFMSEVRIKKKQRLNCLFQIKGKKNENVGIKRGKNKL